MTNIETINTVLARMSVLLRSGSLIDWAKVLEKLSNEIEIDPSATLRKILAMYAGMGSLNDLILYKDGQPLIKENNEFDVLRIQLYQLCLEIG